MDHCMQKGIGRNGHVQTVIQRNTVSMRCVPVLDNWRKDFLDVIFPALVIPERSGQTTRLLEVGCGQGQWILEAAKRGILSTGIDTSRTAITHAKNSSECLSAEAKQRVCFIQADAQHLPFRSDSFDKVLSMQVIEHVPNDAVFVSEIARVGKQNCNVFISTMNTIRRIPLLLWPLFQLHEIRAGHLRGYRHEDLSNSFVRTGFVSKHVMYYTHTIKLVQDIYCAKFHILRTSDAPLWRKITKLDLRFGKLQTGWTFSVHLSRRSN
jgi:2-polyprenyl-3-methyl-5-hydroxy-6-metoxy-1,4-benzoquinol methylase